MKFSAVQLEPVAVGPEEAAKMLGLSVDLFQTLVKCGWLAPSVRQHRLTLYDVSHVRKAWERIKRDGLPRAGGKATSIQSDREPEGA